MGFPIKNGGIFQPVMLVITSELQFDAACEPRTFPVTTKMQTERGQLNMGTAVKDVWVF